MPHNQTGPGVAEAIQSFKLPEKLGFGLVTATTEEHFTDTKKLFQALAAEIS